MYSKHVVIIWTHFGLISVFLQAVLLKLEILLQFTVTSFSGVHLPVHSGSLKRIKYSKLYSLAHTLLFNVFSALKGTNFYILFSLTEILSSPSLKLEVPQFWVR